MPLPLILIPIVAGVAYGGKKILDFINDKDAPAGAEGQNAPIGQLSTIPTMALYAAGGYAAYRLIRKVTE